jgi:hypothetical protein
MAIGSKGGPEGHMNLKMAGYIYAVFLTFRCIQIFDFVSNSYLRFLATFIWNIFRQSRLAFTTSLVMVFKVGLS